MLLQTMQRRPNAPNRDETIDDPIVNRRSITSTVNPYLVGDCHCNFYCRKNSTVANFKVNSIH